MNASTRPRPFGVVPSLHQPGIQVGPVGLQLQGEMFNSTCSTVGSLVEAVGRVHYVGQGEAHDLFEVTGSTVGVGSRCSELVVAKQRATGANGNGT